MKNRIFTILLCLSGFLFLCGLLQKEGWLSAEKIVIPRPCFKYENEKFLIFEYDYVWRDWSLTRSISKWDELLDFL
ncbi:hypothetical protein JYT60_01645, partial [bacterium AH-315-C08]|nr:hypothetical protein [bacterium AH-315-C08]